MVRTTTNQGFTKHGQASGSVIAHVFDSLLSDLDTLLKGRNHESHTISDDGKVALNGGSRTESVVATVVNVDDGTMARFFLDANDNNVVLLGESDELHRLRATATQDVGSISGGDTATFTISVTGAATGDPVAVSPPSGINADLSVTARVTSSDTVTVVVTNPTSGSIDPSSGDYTVQVFDQSSSYTTTEGNDTTANVYYDSGNTRFELENKLGGEKTFEVIFEGE